LFKASALRWRTSFLRLIMERHGKGKFGPVFAAPGRRQSETASGSRASRRADKARGVDPRKNALSALFKSLGLTAAEAALFFPPAPKSKCGGCGVTLTPENDSAAHVIPNALGGRLKPKGILCRVCNDELDELADNALIEAFGGWPKANNEDSFVLSGFDKPMQVAEAEAILRTFDDVDKDARAGKFDPEKRPDDSPQRPRKQLVVKANIQSIDYSEARRDILLSVPEIPNLPAGLRQEVVLKTHQLSGVAWLQHLFQSAPQHCRGAVLADDMGLGEPRSTTTGSTWLPSAVQRASCFSARRAAQMRPRLAGMPSRTLLQAKPLIVCATLGSNSKRCASRINPSTVPPRSTPT
jgi:hypothetical protein